MDKPRIITPDPVGDHLSKMQRIHMAESISGVLTVALVGTGDNRRMAVEIAGNMPAGDAMLALVGAQGQLVARAAGGRGH